MPQTFFHNSLYLEKDVLIRLTPYHRQPGILQFCDNTKGVPLISTGSLGLQVPVAVAKFSDLVIGYSLLREFLQNYAFSGVKKLQIAGLPMVQS